MAVYSMTGYACVQSDAAAPGVGLGVELRSVNSRFLDVVLKVPDAFKPHEARLRQVLTEHIGRGKVELRLTLNREPMDQAQALNVVALQKLAALQAMVQTWLPDARSLSVAEVLQLQQAKQAEHVDWLPEYEQVLLQAVVALKAARQAEGQRLAVFLREKLVQLKALADQAQPLVPQLVEQQRRKFLERWQEALGLAQTGAATSLPEPKELEQRALTEATAFAIRIDVAEELSRLHAHLDEMDGLLGAQPQTGVPRPIGKRLDFLIQELHREANTLGSKSALLELSRISMEMKVLIEQMREQVQNIE